MFTIFYTVGHTIQFGSVGTTLDLALKHRQSLADIPSSSLYGAPSDYKLDKVEMMTGNIKNIRGWMPIQSTYTLQLSCLLNLKLKHWKVIIPKFKINIRKAIMKVSHAHQDHDCYLNYISIKRWKKERKKKSHIDKWSIICCPRNTSPGPSLM